MSHPAFARALAIAVCVPAMAAAQMPTYPLPDLQPYDPQAADAGSPWPPPDSASYQVEPPPPDPAAPPDPVPLDPLLTEPQPGLVDATTPPPADSAALLDGHVRSGPFLAGPGSFSFILQHSLLGAMGGFGTQLISARYDFARGKEGILIGTLLGAGIGFGISTWWQFTHWMDAPVGIFSIANAVYAGMLAAGMVDVFSTDSTALAWASFVGAELGSWLTAIIGGGELRLADGLAMVSAGGWTASLGALIMATLATSGGTPPTSKSVVDMLLVTPGLGAAAMAVALTQIRPSAAQVLRADVSGASLGAIVLLVSGLILGFDTPTPYVLTMLSAAGAITAISLFWVEAAEKSPDGAAARSPNSIVSRGRPLARPYSNPWW
jgi:hypothetical protein